MSISVTTPGRTLLREILPEEISVDSPLRKAEIGRLFEHLARNRPDEYVDILDSLNRKAVRAATEYGDTASFSLEDIRIPRGMHALRETLRGKVRDITQSPKLTPAQKNDRVVKLMRSVSDDIRKRVVDEADAEGNRFAFSAKVGVRGNPVQISQMLFGDLLMADHKGRPVPVPGLHGYGEGLSPAEFFAGAYGSRAGFASVQLNTQKSGFLTKQMTLLNHAARVTGEDCGADSVGIPLSGDDPDIIGNVLAEDAGGFKKGHVVERRDLPKLKDRDEVLVRSLLTCQQPEGVCARCTGLREDGKFPVLGDFVGVDSTRMIGEPITQEMLCLHPDTEVLMADGSPRRMRDIRIGDMVMGADIGGNLFPTAVLDVIASGDRELAVFRYGDFEGNELEIYCSLDHKVLAAPFDKVAAGSARSVWNTELERVFVLEGMTIHGAQKAMDLEVGHEDRLFVLANGVAVSNSSKHVGGIVEGSGEEDENERGFQVLERIFNVPGHFPNKAALAPREGKVGRISKAPQGGHYLFVGGEQVHVPEGRVVKVSEGDEVDAGDVLSSGIPNPREVARYKGIGAGRLYFLKQLQGVLEGVGIKTHIRNLEPLARDFFDRVEITDPRGWNGRIVGDVVRYSDVQREWVPRRGSTIQRPKYARGRYLEKPVLEYSIGTVITPKIAKRLEDRGVGEIVTSEEKPPFEPKVVALMNVPATDPDFRARMGAWNLKKSFLSAAREGAESPRRPTSYITGLMDPAHLSDYPKG